MQHKSSKNTNPARYAVKYAQNALRAQGTIDKPDVAAEGQFAEDLHALYMSRQEGGIAAAERVWEQMLHTHPELAARRDRMLRFPILSIDELAQLPKQEYLVDREIPKNGLVALFGPSGVGKTFVALNWYGLPLSKEHSVVYVAGEGVPGYPQRIEAWRQHTGTNASELQFHLCTKPVNFLKEGDVDTFIEEIREYDPKVLFLDTFSRSIPGGDENGSRDVTTFIANSDRIRTELDCVVIVIHHTGKTAGEGARGHSSFLAACDVALELKGRPNCIELSCVKAKDTEPAETKALRLQVIELEDGSTSCVVVPTSAKAATNEEEDLRGIHREILEALTLEVFSEAGARLQQIVEVTERAKSTIYRYLSDLKKRGLISQGKRGDPFKLTSLGKAKLQGQNGEGSEDSVSPDTTGSKNTEAPSVDDSVTSDTDDKGDAEAPATKESGENAAKNADTKAADTDALAASNADADAHGKSTNTVEIAETS
jgi:hypothetical protein